tara:strand:- start:907 stop:1167 length:261 start_codon:yes stop_codon:yes gene_type:complete
MVTAIMYSPQGEVFTPRYELKIFDNLDQCQTFFTQDGMYEKMYANVQKAFPNRKIRSIGCGAWDMDKLLDKTDQIQKSIDTLDEFI